MIEHGDVLELIAASIDFELSAEERWEIQTHLATCARCRRIDAQLRADAAAIPDGPSPQLEPLRARQILTAAMRPRRTGPPLRILGIAAVLALLGGGALAVGTDLFKEEPKATQQALVPSPPAVAPDASGEPGVESTDPPVEPTSQPGKDNGPSATQITPESAILVRGDAASLPIAMQPGPGGGLYVLVGGRRQALALLDADGLPRAGWPVRLRGLEACSIPGTADDGSVRLVCWTGPDELRLFAFDRRGNALPGWPVVLHDERLAEGGQRPGSSVVSGNRLLLLTHRDDPDGQSAGQTRILSLGRDGSVNRGKPVDDPDSDLGWRRGLGPDGVAVVVGYPATGTAPGTSTLVAFDRGGVRHGWPIQVDGLASVPSFRQDGEVVLQVGTQEGPHSRLVLLGPDGSVSAESDEVAADGRGEGGGLTYGPTVGADGHAYLIDQSAGTTVFGFEPNGAERSRWPYQASSRALVLDPCVDVGVPCAPAPVPPVVGPTGLVYVLHPPSGVRGGRVTAITASAQVRAGWPVDLVERQGVFRALVVGPDATAFALAVEPEAGQANSATILAIEPDSTVRWTSTVVEP